MWRFGLGAAPVKGESTSTPDFRPPSGLSYYRGTAEPMRRIALLALLSACTTLTDQPLPDGAEPFVPPAIYLRWWDLTQACSGLSGNWSALTWYRVPDVGSIVMSDGTSAQGRWDAVRNRIILAGDVVLAGDLVRHEMLHALLRSPGHPRPEFVTRCRGVVVCTKTCITDAAPSPQPDPLALPVRPTALQIAVEITPAAPGAAVNGGNFMMIVTARNAAATPVIVQLPSSGDSGPSASFSSRIVGNSRDTFHDIRAEVPEDAAFAPGEVKRFIFDFHVGAGPTRYELPPGTYRFDGAYGGVWSSGARTVTVSP